MQNSEFSYYTNTDNKLFKEQPLHFIMTNKHGGISKGSFSSLNLAYHVNDEKSNVQHNRQIIMQKYYPNKTLLYLNQIHSNAIFMIHPNANHTTHLNTSLHTYNQDTKQSHKQFENTISKNNNNEILLGNADGIICHDKQFVLMSMVADCNPILIYAKNTNVIAILHAGRIGVLTHILSHAILLLTQYYQIQIKDLLIFIGASIRKCCYAIDSNLAHNIKEKFGEKSIITINNDNKFDMLALLQDEINTFGIKTQQITISPICSCCNTNYFSYRREGQCGRFALFASLL